MISSDSLSGKQCNIFRILWILSECERKNMSLCLGEFPDEAQLEVSDDEEDESHDSQSQMILPQTPG